ncbi:MAG: hypothetical protein IBX59_14620, partial [Yoonia sp.]|nr:hypothetical protein [Yoonia sp.]
MQNISLSLITAIKPKRLSKAYSLGANGDLLKMSGGNLTQGKVAVLTLGGLSDLGMILQSLTPAQALIYGVPLNDAQTILTRKAHAELGQPKGATTRTNDAFRWPQGGGVLMLDYDPPAGSAPLDRDALVQAVREAAPGLADVAMLWTPSASSCIYKGGTALRGVMGQRLYVLVNDADDIPRAGKALVSRLWLAGHGHIEISASGNLLERTLVDASVWQESRLDFAGGAQCGPGLEQRRGAPVIIPGDIEQIDTRAALPDLTPGEIERVIEIKIEAKGAMHVEAEGVKEHWIAARVQEMVPAGECPDPETLKEAQATARRALETGILAGDFVVQVEVKGKIEPISVGELLDNRALYHGCLTLDPLEPAYDGGRLVGRLFLFQARPSLYSFAHGGKAFRLERAPQKIEIVRGHTAEAATATIDLLRRDPVTFDFGGQLSVAENGRVHPLCEHGLAYHLSGITQFWKTVKSGDVYVPQDCDPAPALLKQIIALGERRKLKPLDAVITAPTIRLDGSVLDAPGYDAETRLLFDPMGEAVPDVPVNPTIDQARAALDLLMTPFATFPFVDSPARGALLAAILTAPVRAVLPT